MDEDIEIDEDEFDPDELKDLDEDELERLKELAEVEKIEEEENEEDEELEELDDDDDIKTETESKVDAKELKARQEIREARKERRPEKIKLTKIDIDLRTQDFPTLFEKAAMITIRTAQIYQDGGATYSKNAREFDSAKEKAMAELNEGLMPLKVVRQIGHFHT